MGRIITGKEMKNKQKSRLLKLINEYGELRFEAGDSLHLDNSKYIEFFNESEEIFNQILEIIDGE